MGTALASTGKSFILALCLTGFSGWLCQETWSLLDFSQITQATTISGDSPLLLLPLLAVSALIGLISLWICLSHLLVSICLTLVHSGIRINLVRLAQLTVLAPQARKILSRSLASSVLLSSVVLTNAQAATEKIDPLEDLRWGSPTVVTQTINAPAHTPSDILKTPETTPVLLQTTQKIHTVQAGDSLWSIAARTLNTSDPATITHYWQEIWKLNRSLIGDNPHLILPGQVLTLPTTH